MITSMSKVAATVVIVALASGLSGCSKKIKELEDKLDKLTNVVDDGLKNVTDVGVISELGWLSKLLRDSATGTVKEQEEAKSSIARLFGIDLSKFKDQQYFEVTVQISNFDLKDGEHLYIDTKYLPNDKPETLKALFAKAPGNQWSRQSVRDVANTIRSEEEIRKLLAERLNKLFSPVTCRRNVFAKVDSGNCNYGFAYSQGQEWVGPVNKPKVAEAIGNARQGFQQALLELFMTPTEVVGLPPAGWMNGQLRVAFGLTGGASPFFAVLMPQKQVKQHPKLELRAWLHPRGQPERPLGVGHQIEAVDFAARCNGSITYENPTLPIDSKSSDGDLCWYTFDLFGAGTLARMAELASEAASYNPPEVEQPKSKKK